MMNKTASHEDSFSLSCCCYYSPRSSLHVQIQVQIVEIYYTIYLCEFVQDL